MQTKVVCTDSLRGDSREAAVWARDLGVVSCGVGRCPRQDAESEGAEQERKECSWWRAQHRQRPGVGMRGHTLGAMRNLLVGTEVRGTKGWPWVSSLPAPFPMHEASGRDQTSDAQVFCLALKVGHPLQRRPAHFRYI